MPEQYFLNRTLVYNILKYAGVSMDKDSIMRAGQGMEMAKVSQEKQ